MRSNTDRSARTAFDAVAEDYDTARPRFGAEHVARLLRWAGVEPGARVLEVGAGTGQLTAALLELGHRVVAVEPGRQMADRLRALPGPGELRVLAAPVAEVDLGAESFGAVVAANSFHWLDPEREHRVVADALEPGGRLVLLWTFLGSDDPVLARLAEDDVVGPQVGFLDVAPGRQERVERLAREGREELDGAGLFRVDAWQVERRHETRDASGLVALVRSFANVAALPRQRREELEERMVEILAEHGRPEVVLEVLTYAVVASRACDPR